MRHLPRLSALGLALALCSAPGMATGISMNEVVLPQGATVDSCKAAGRSALSKAGLKALPEAPVSVFGAAPNDDLASIYCLPQRGIAIIAVAGADNFSTRPLLGVLMQAFSAP